MVSTGGVREREPTAHTGQAEISQGERSMRSERGLVQGRKSSVQRVLSVAQSSPKGQSLPWWMSWLVS